MVHQDAGIQAFRKRLGGTIRQRRKELGLSQESFAERVNAHRNYVGLVERGEQNMTLEKLVKLCRAFGCQPSELLPEIPLEENYCPGHG